MNERFNAKVQKYQHYDAVIPLAVSARLVFHPETKAYLESIDYFKVSYLSEIAVMSARHFSKTKQLATIDDVKEEERCLEEMGLGNTW